MVINHATVLVSKHSLPKCVVPPISLQILRDRNEVHSDAIKSAISHPIILELSLISCVHSYVLWSTEWFAVGWQDARLFGPAIFEAAKLKVLFLGAGKKHPEELPRIYTLTHSDVTSMITLAISREINKAQVHLPKVWSDNCSDFHHLLQSVWLFTMRIMVLLFHVVCKSFEVSIMVNFDRRYGQDDSCVHACYHKLSCW